MKEMSQGKAYFTYDKDYGSNLWYFGMLERASGKLTQREVRAIIDIDADGCLAGVELIDDMPPLFSSTPEDKTNGQ